MKRLVQYYQDENYLRVFSLKTKSGEKLLDINSEKIIDAKSAKLILKALGFKFSKVDKTDWGFEVTIEY